MGDLLIEFIFWFLFEGLWELPGTIEDFKKAKKAREERERENQSQSSN